MKRQLDDWYRTYSATINEGAELSDRATACWTKTGERYSRARLLRMLRSPDDSWNKWRASLPNLEWYCHRNKSFWIPGFILRLRQADLENADLSGKYLSSAEFDGSNFRKANFTGATFYWSWAETIQHCATANNCSFVRAKLISTNLSYATLRDADFSHAELNGARANSTDLSGAKFKRCMVAAKFENTKLTDADFVDAYIIGSSFIDVDLSSVQGGLGDAHLYPPITVDVRTLVRSGPLPRDFYLASGANTNAAQIFMKSFLRAETKGTCFISHSSKDERFVNSLRRELEREAIQTWYAPRDLSIGSRIRNQLDEAIIKSAKLVLVLSRASLSSDWVEQEVEAALERERKEKISILMPITIDDAVMKARKGWAVALRRTRHIGAFDCVYRSSEYFKALGRLIDDIGR